MFECDPLEANSFAQSFPEMLRANAWASRASLPPFVVRATTLHDKAAVETHLYDANAQALAEDYDVDVLRKALPIIAAPKDSVIRSGSYFVADCGAGRLLAAGGWNWHGPVGGVAPRDTAHVRHFAVGRAFTGRGIGRLVMEHVVASARAQGVTRLLCMVPLPFQGFYEVCGFEKRCDVQLTLGPGLYFPAVQMSIQI